MKNKTEYSNFILDLFKKNIISQPETFILLECKSNRTKSKDILLTLFKENHIEKEDLITWLDYIDNQFILELSNVLETKLGKKDKFLPISQQIYFENPKYIPSTVEPIVGCEVSSSTAKLNNSEQTTDTVKQKISNIY